NKLTRMNKMTWRLVSPFDLNVYFLLAKKLKQNAVAVEIILAPIAGSPSAFRIKSTEKSIVVFRPPTRTKRNFVLSFSATWVIFLYKIKWTIFGFVKDTGDIF